MKNTKTTLAGVGAILVAVGGALKALFDGDPTTNLDLTTTIAAVTAAMVEAMSMLVLGSASKVARRAPPTATRIAPTPARVVFVFFIWI